MTLKNYKHVSCLSPSNDRRRCVSVRLRKASGHNNSLLLPDKGKSVQRELSAASIPFLISVFTSEHSITTAETSTKLIIFILKDCVEYFEDAIKLSLDSKIPMRSFLFITILLNRNNRRMCGDANANPIDNVHVDYTKLCEFYDSRKSKQNSSLPTHRSARLRSC